MAKEYQRHRQRASVDSLELPAIVVLAGEVEEKRVLDAGCGLGKHAKVFLDKGAEVTGIDVSQKMVELAQRYCGDKGKFFQADFERAKFRPGSFDIIIASLSVYYSKDLYLVFKNFSDWLRPNGEIIFSILHPLGYSQMVPDLDMSQSHSVSLDFKGFSSPIDCYFHPLEKYFDVLRENNLKLIKLIEPVAVDHLQPPFIIFKVKKGV